GRQQHYAGEDVGQALLRGDADQHPGQGTAHDQLGDRDAEQLQRDDDGGESARQDHGEADDPRVRRPDRRLQDVAGLVAEPERRDAPEQEERDGRAVFQDPVAGLAQRAEPRGGLGLTRQGQQIRGAASLDRYGGRDDGEHELEDVTPRPGAGPDL